MPPRVQLWKNALLDLTLRNRLLNLDQPLTQVRLLVPDEQLGTLADLLQDGKSVSIRAVDDLTGAVISEGARDAYALPADVQRAMLSPRSTIYSGQAKDAHERELARLRYRARTGREETGANPLMLVLGRLDWRLGDRELTAPLLLMPVEIRGLVMPYRIAADPSGSVGINLSLLQKLQLEFGFSAPQLTELPLRPDGEGVDVDAVLRMFREALAAAGLAFRVESEARLIIGGFTGYLLWRDLDQHWGDFADRPLVRQLLAEREPDAGAAELRDRRTRSGRGPGADRRRRVAGPGDRVRAAGRELRAGGPARHGQVPDDHQHPGRSTDGRPDRAVRGREGRGAGRGPAAAGRGGAAAVHPGSA